jgi:hypothetical protein
MMLDEVLFEPDDLKYPLTVEPVLEVSVIGIDAQVLVNDLARMLVLRGKVLLSQLSR